jgi:hypothetical protein
MTRAFVGLCLGVAACAGPDTETTDKDTTDTDTDTTGTTPTTEETAASGASGASGDSGTTTGGGGGPLITQISVSCDDKNFVTLFVEANAWSGGGLVYMQETGNIAPQYSEDHLISSYLEDPKGKWDRLKITLETGAKAPGVSQVSTAFTCDGHFELPDPGVMTYVIAITDTMNEITDCVAAGHDPMGMINGLYVDSAAYPAPPRLGDFSNCVAGELYVAPKTP